MTAYARKARIFLIRLSGKGRKASPDEDLHPGFLSSVHLVLAKLDFPVTLTFSRQLDQDE